MDASQVIIRPVVSEKSFVLAEIGKYTFRVHPDAHKTQIRQAIEQIFGVRVLKVNTLNRKGKRVRNRRTGVYSTKPSSKRAVVTLVEGQTIDLFQG